MKILFCKVSDMKYYKGACDDDVPQFGGSFVDEYGYGHEEYNFYPVKNEENGKIECMGFVEPKHNNGKRNTIHIERIRGCEDLKKADFADDVLVVWCATRDMGYTHDISVVGWYKNATVWRNMQDWVVDFGDYSEERHFNVRAEAKDCVLLPYNVRNERKWWIPTSKYTKAYGFGQSMLWYADEPKAGAFIERLLNSIDTYRGENHVDKYPKNI